MLKPDDRIGDWVVVAPLGEGGMGSVYRCKNALSERITAAVKVIKPHGLDATERFIREAESLYALRHPAVVRVTGFGEDTEKQLLWLAMELVSGEDLSKRLAKGPIKPEMAQKLFRLYASGLAHAHQRGIFHRDIKPANLTLDTDGTGVILDFGIAVSDGRTKLTQEGLIPGTLPYMPPEVFEGEMAEQQKTDIYSLGLALYESLTGSSAFPEDPESSGSHQMVRMMSLKLKSTRMELDESFPFVLRNAVSMATEPNPNERLATMADFVRLLNNERPVDTKHSHKTWVEDPKVASAASTPAPETLWLEESSKAPAQSRPTTPRKKSKLGFIVGSLAATGVVGVVGLVVLAILIIAGVWMMNSSKDVNSSRFVQACEEANKGTLNEAQAATFSLLKKQQNQSDCGLLWAEVGDQTEYTLKYGQQTTLDLGVFREMSRLQKLALHDVSIKDMSPLLKLVELEKVAFHGSTLSDLDTLSQLNRLEELVVTGSHLKTLPDIRNVKVLDLSDNQLESISILAKFESLETLNLSSNQITDLMPLKSLKALKTLQVSGNPIRSKKCPTSSSTNASVRAQCKKLFAPRASSSNSSNAGNTSSHSNGTTSTNAASSNNSSTDFNALPVLTLQKLEGVFKQNYGLIQACYDSYVQRVPNLSGTLTLFISIDRTGKVIKASSERTGVNSVDFAKCVEKAVQQMTFPASSKATHLTRPFVFKAPESTLKVESATALELGPQTKVEQYAFTVPDCSRAENQSNTSVRSLISYADYYMRQISLNRDVKRSCGIALSNLRQAYCKDKSQQAILRKIDAQCWKLGVR